MPNDKWHGEARDPPGPALRGVKREPPFPVLHLISHLLAASKPITPGLLGAMLPGLEIVVMLIHLQIAQLSTRYH